MRGLSLLWGGLCLCLAVGEEARQERLFNLIHLLGRPRPVSQSLIIVKPSTVHTGSRPVYVTASRPVYPAPSRPVYPVKPVYPAPTQPVYPAPTQPVYPAPTQPVYPAPVEVHPAPVVVQPAPVVVHPAPTHPGSVSGPLCSWHLPELAGRQFSWHQANNECRKRSLRLISLEDPNKDAFVRQMISQNRINFIWTSGQLSGNRWIWSGTGQPVSYTNWGFGEGGHPQPDNREGNEVCLAVLNSVYGDGIKWHDIACHHVKDFCCE